MGDSDGRVTIAIPTIRGRESYLARAVTSAAKQRRPADRILILMDHERRGADWARNEALTVIDTEWVAWLDDDDELLPEHLQRLLQCASTEYDLVYPGMIAVGGRDPLATMHRGALVDPFGVPFGPEQEQHLRFVGNFIPVTNLMRVSLAKAVGGFPRPRSAEFAQEEDYGLLLRLLDGGAQFRHCPFRTWRYNFHDSNTGGRGRDEDIPVSR